MNKQNRRAFLQNSAAAAALVAMRGVAAENSISEARSRDGSHGASIIIRAGTHRHRIVVRTYQDGFFKGGLWKGDDIGILAVTLHPARELASSSSTVRTTAGGASARRTRSSSDTGVGPKSARTRVRASVSGRTSGSGGGGASSAVATAEE